MEVDCYNHLIILVLYMKKYNSYLFLFASLILYFLLWKMLNPILGYNLDSDSVSYLTIAKRVAEGDYFRSVNGLWSPMNSWLLAPFIQQGKDAWQSAKLLNFIFGFVILIQIFFLFKKFFLQNIAVYIMQFASAICMVCFVYFQMFGDVLQLIFVLVYLLLLFQKNKNSISLFQSILFGILMGIGFYAKAYSLFFFGVHFFITLVWFVYTKKITLKKAALNYVVGIATSILIILPWTFALHKKYDQWALNGFAGKLNMSWYINSGKSFKPDIDLLIPPTYNNSPSFWEDPYITQANLSSPFSSFYHFAKWIARIIHTKIMMIFCFNEISFLSLSILLIGFFYFFIVKKKSKIEHHYFNIRLMIITIIILPLGYLMMHIETRYIWLNVFLLMILGAKLIELAFKHVTIKPYLLYIFYFILAYSFVVFPIYQFQNLKNKNKDLKSTQKN